jgi:hypothetical protein
MSRLATILLGPLWVSRRRKKKLLLARSELNPATQQDDYARLTEQIQFEDDFVASFASFVKEQQATRLKQSMSVSSKGILQLLGLTVLVFVAIGLKRCFFG